MVRQLDSQETAHIVAFSFHPQTSLRVLRHLSLLRTIRRDTVLDLEAGFQTQ